MELLLTGLGMAVLCCAPLAIGRLFGRMQAREQWRRRARRTKIVQIREAQAGELVRVAGRVRPLGDVLRLPFSGVEGVYHSTEINNPSNISGPEMVQFARFCPFIVEDESGGAVVLSHARIDALVEREYVGHVERDDPELIDLLGDVLEEWLGKIPFSWRQRRIETGQTVVVWGRAEFEAVATASGATLAGGFREPPRRLVIAPVDGVVVVELRA